MGLFKPAWMGKNEEKALKSVSNIIDWVTLIDIIQTSPHNSVRVAAIKKLPYPHIDQYTGRICSLKFIKEQNVLADVFHNSSVYMLRLEAVTYLTDLSILSSLAKGVNSQTIQSAIMKRIEELSDNAVEIVEKGFDNKCVGINILVEYRMGLTYLDSCGVFDEEKFREFNEITGNRFSDTDIGNQLKGARMMINGMEELKHVLRSNMVEAIATFEKMEREGVDLSKYKL